MQHTASRSPRWRPKAPRKTSLTDAGIMSGSRRLYPKSRYHSRPADGRRRDPGQAAGGRNTISGWVLRSVRKILQPFCSQQLIETFCKLLNLQCFNSWFFHSGYRSETPTVADEYGEI